ncbi:hypothetical protein [Arthrobacter sp. D5-1]|uniref:alpha-glutamyl/putrescinyl thymine pyrophosphorylase clade 3 protein n=1 Tax=Arthrobacter sp. D5-1 TaxID=1477518 RepID=UPI001A98BB88|nr:hypothetical protein [Arthrobacter sp. D5-1]
MSTSGKAERPYYQPRFDKISERIRLFEKNIAQLPGIEDDQEREVLVNQLIDSERRNEHFDRLLNRKFSQSVTDPHDELFDPLKAAIYHWGQGNEDEACWLVFQFVHFGKHPIAGWRFVREVYGRLGGNPLWSWDEITGATPEFRIWLGENQKELLRKDQRRGFGNHRKYSSLSHESARGTASVFESYVEWIMTHGSHRALIENHSVGHSPTETFESLYRAMSVVMDFGRIAKFDYLMTMSRLRFFDLRPGHSYLKGATGPLRGARLLTGGPGASTRAQELEDLLAQFSSVVGVTPDVVEDAVCNWQKSPAKFRKFVL